MRRVLGVLAMAGLFASLAAASVAAAPPVATTKISGGFVFFVSATCPLQHHMIITLGYGPNRPVHTGGGVSDNGWLDVQAWDENCSNPGVQID